MRNRLRTGTTEENDSWTYPSGVVTADSEKNALRIHDGETPGGYEVVGERAYEPPTGPGPETLEAGDGNAGFYGEVAAEDFITANDLAAAIGTSKDILYSDTNWLKFSHEGKTLFVMKKPFTNDSWRSIYDEGCVYGTDDFGLYPPTDSEGEVLSEVNQRTVVTIEDNDYLVRLLTGGDDDPYTELGGEWDALMYPIQEGIDEVTSWANYTESELGFDADGSRTLCQETDDDNTISRLWRNFGYEVAGGVNNNGFNTVYGWRPVLELLVNEG